MRILAIDTALTACSGALWDDGEAVGVIREPAARGQAERLAPLVQTLLAEADWQPGDLDRIAVTTGPGSFTGVRVGLAFARSFALALGRPCVGLSSLEVLAAGAAAERCVAAITMAGSLFVAAYEGRRPVLAPVRADSASAVAGRLGAGWTVTGPGAPALLAVAPDWIHVGQSDPDPLVLAGLAAFADPADRLPVPLYLRGADALLPGGRRLDEASP